MCRLQMLDNLIREIRGGQTWCQKCGLTEPVQSRCECPHAGRAFPQVLQHTMRIRHIERARFHKPRPSSHVPVCHPDHPVTAFIAQSVTRINLKIQLHAIADAIVGKADVVLERPLPLPL